MKAEDRLGAARVPALLAAAEENRYVAQNGLEPRMSDVKEF